LGRDGLILKQLVNATPLNPKEIVTIQELAISNMFEFEALRQLLFQKAIIAGEEFIAK
jgi:hypothetical protein